MSLVRFLKEKLRRFQLSGEAAALCGSDLGSRSRKGLLSSRAPARGCPAWCQLGPCRCPQGTVTAPTVRGWFHQEASRARQIAEQGSGNQTELGVLGGLLCSPLPLFWEWGFNPFCQGHYTLQADNLQLFALSLSTLGSQPAIWNIKATTTRLSWSSKSTENLVLSLNLLIG